MTDVLQQKYVSFLFLTSLNLFREFELVISPMVKRIRVKFP